MTGVVTVPPSYHDDVDPEAYDAALASKAATLRARFAPLLHPRGGVSDPRNDADVNAAAGGAAAAVEGALERHAGISCPGWVEPEVFPSPPVHFRSRCRFAVVREDVEPTGSDAMSDATTSAAVGIVDVSRCRAPRPRLGYRLWENGGPNARVDDGFPMALESINGIMPAVLRLVEAEEALSDGIEAVHFLAARGGGMLVTLVYSSGIGEAWRRAAREMRNALAAHLPAAEPSGDASVDDDARRTTLNVLGRSRGVAMLAPNDDVENGAAANYVVETLRLSDGRALTYKQAEGAFSNPNAYMAESTLEWLCDCSRTVIKDALARRTDRGERTDAGAGSANSSGAEAPDASERLPSLLELYSGNGNHTVALAGMYRHVAAVELSEVLCDAARDNLRRNGVHNALVLHSPSEKVARGMLRRKTTKMRERSDAEVSASGSAPSVEAERVADASDGAGCVKDGRASFDVDDYDVVLVDPPRAGLDKDTLELVSRFEAVLYISCNPAALLDNALGGRAGGRDGGETREAGMAGLSKTHDLVRFAVFDHFPYTRHVECGACFLRRPR